jgi:hypothetical protein
MEIRVAIVTAIKLMERGEIEGAKLKLGWLVGEIERGMVCP